MILSLIFIKEFILEHVILGNLLECVIYFSCRFFQENQPVLRCRQTSAPQGPCPTIMGPDNT